LGEVSYRNAMTTISARGWRRDEPGLVSAIEQPSLLPRAVELLAQEGITRDVLVQQCRVPVELFRTVTARTPGVPPSDPQPATSGTGRRVVSLLHHPDHK
ncbi:MAG: Xre family DNA binding protein, partial [Actinomycetota bacterium]|nr:Xre family DNA binding protein [Actinomycetota bacterium]